MSLESDYSGQDITFSVERHPLSDGVNGARKDGLRAFLLKRDGDVGEYLIVDALRFRVTTFVGFPDHVEAARKTGGLVFDTDRPRESIVVQERGPLGI